MPDSQFEWHSSECIRHCRERRAAIANLPPRWCCQRIRPAYRQSLPDEFNCTGRGDAVNEILPSPGHPLGRGGHRVAEAAQAIHVFASRTGRDPGAAILPLWLTQRAGRMRSRRVRRRNGKDRPETPCKTTVRMLSFVGKIAQLREKNHATLRVVYGCEDAAREPLGGAR